MNGVLNGTLQWEVGGVGIAGDNRILPGKGSPVGIISSRTTQVTAETEFNSRVYDQIYFRIVASHFEADRSVAVHSISGFHPHQHIIDLLINQGHFLCKGSPWGFYQQSTVFTDGK